MIGDKDFNLFDEMYYPMRTSFLLGRRVHQAPLQINRGHGNDKVRILVKQVILKDT